MSLGEVRDTSAAETPGDGRPSEGAAHAVVAARAQAAAAERAHGPRRSTEPESAYAGLVTRAVAFAIDAAIVDLAGLAVGVVVGLALSVLETPDKVDNALLVIGGVLFVIWTIGYFVVFWSTTGQTPGNRVMRIRVRRSGSDEPLRLRWAVVRLVGLLLAAIPLLLGFVPILLNDRRRGLQDLLGRSVVVGAPEVGLGEASAHVKTSSTS
jgi:uncharacterized RDD family membrane protein YckC